MILKSREKSLTHRILESLNSRTNLPEPDKKKYENQIKGLEGEKEFDSLLEHYHENVLVINDLNLSSGDRDFQIDSLVITSDSIFLYEIKNYSGSYYFQDGLIYSRSGHMLLNPSGQMERSKVLLHNLLHTLGFRLQVKSYIVFVHPDFNVRSLPPKEDVLFSDQLENHFRFFMKQNRLPGKKQFDLAKKILACDNNHYRPAKLPDYEYEQLKKGILCSNCLSNRCTNTRQNRFCSACGQKEPTAHAIKRSIEEFEILFPEIPLTTNVIHDWCGGEYSKRRFRRVLKEHYQSNLSRKQTYYSKLQED